MILMMYVLLVGYEYMQIHPNKLLEMICFFIFSFVVGYMIVYIPLFLIVIFLFVYVINHKYFLWEEKLFASIIIVFNSLCALQFWCTDDIFYILISALLFAILEYIAKRIIVREENKVVIYQNKLMKQQIDEIEHIYLTMRGWRHDYHNHLQSLKGYLNLGQIMQMQTYLNELEEDLDSIDTLYHSGNLQMDAILNAKLTIAQKDGIKIVCNADIPPKLHVSDIDLCVIIGNLLDNAIESCRKIVDVEDRFIRIYIGILKRQLYISVTNATNETVRQRTESYFSKKRGDHGYGLKRVDQLIEKYEGYLNRQNEPGVFATEIMLPL